MAEYTKVIEQFKRMCWYYSRDKVQKSCPMCTSYPNCNIGQCRKIAFKEPEHFAAIVMQWAAEHPEPVYPTWAEFLHEAFCERYPMPYRGDAAWYAFLRETHIPADIAQKLGIEPKEGV